MSALVWNGESTSQTVYGAIDNLYSSYYSGQKKAAVLERSVHAQSWMLTLVNANCVSIDIVYSHTIPNNIFR